jgi:hypothetical protein
LLFISYVLNTILLYSPVAHPFHLLLYFALKGDGVTEKCKHKTGRSNMRIKMLSLVRRIHNICRKIVCEMNEI